MSCSDKSAKDISVTCGEWLPESKNATYQPADHKIQRLEAKSIMTHPEFERTTNFNDFAVIVLEDSFDTSVPHIGPICLPTDEEDDDISFEGCFATGWGKDKYGRKGDYAGVMKHVQLDMVETKEKCQELLRKTDLTKFFNLDPSFNCAGGKKGVDLCTGDGGGPLVCPKKSNSQQFVQVSQHKTKCFKSVLDLAYHCPNFTCPHFQKF